MNNRLSSRHGQRGYSIIEVLVAVLVMTLGILGITGLQSTSLAFNTQSLQRTKAAYLSYEILDRMRANPDQLYSVALDANPGTQECFTTNCTPAQLMAFDLAEWKCALGKYTTTETCVALANEPGALIHAMEALPGGDGSVVCAVNGGVKSCTVVVRWQERADKPNTATPQQRTYQVTTTI